MHRVKNPNPQLSPPQKAVSKPVPCEGRGCLLVLPNPGRNRQESPAGAACGGRQRGLSSRTGTPGVVTAASPPGPVRRGHRAYLSSAPHYDFPRYRQLVHEVTVAFSGISREVLAIAGRLRDELGRPELAQHLARLQEREQEKLQLVGAGLGWGGSLGLLWGVSALMVSPHRRRSCSWPGSRHRTSQMWTPISRRCRSSSTSRWWPRCCPPSFWEGSVPPSPEPPLPSPPAPVLGWCPLPSPQGPELGGIVEPRPGAPCLPFPALPAAQGGPDGAFGVWRRCVAASPRPPRAECFINSAGKARRPT